MKQASSPDPEPKQIKTDNETNYIMNYTALLCPVVFII